VLFVVSTMALILIFFSTSQVIGWEEHIQNDLLVSSGTLNINSVNLSNHTTVVWDHCY